MEAPLTERDEINRRLDAVEALVRDRMTGLSLAEELEGVYDMERLLSKISYRSLNARDCLSLKTSLSKIPELKNLLIHSKCKILRGIFEDLDPLDDLTEMLEKAIDEVYPNAKIDPKGSTITIDFDTDCMYCDFAAVQEILVPHLRFF